MPLPVTLWRRPSRHPVVHRVVHRVIPLCHSVMSCRHPSCRAVARHVVPSPVALCRRVVPSWRRVVPSRRAVTCRIMPSPVVLIDKKFKWQHELRRHDATGDGMMRWTMVATRRHYATPRRHNATARRDGTIWRHNGTTTRRGGMTARRDAHLASLEHHSRIPCQVFSNRPNVMKIVLVICVCIERLVSNHTSKLQTFELLLDWPIIMFINSNQLVIPALVLGQVGAVILFPVFYFWWLWFKSHWGQCTGLKFKFSFVLHSFSNTCR